MPPAWRVRVRVASTGRGSLLEVLGEVGEAGTDGALLDVVVDEGIGGLEAVAGDADDGESHRVRCGRRRKGAR